MKSIYSNPWDKFSQRIERFDTSKNRVIVSGCDRCKRCCKDQHSFVELVLLEKQNKRLFYRYNKQYGIHPEKGCKQITEVGCRIINNNNLPITCAIYPYFLIGKNLYVHKGCNAFYNTTMVQIQRIGYDVMRYLSSFDEEFLLKISTYDSYNTLLDLQIEIVYTY